MKSSAVLLSLLTGLSLATAAQAAGINMDDPNRALGREGDVRVDAQLVQPSVSPGAPIGFVYQIQNFTSEPVAVADKVFDASYDQDSRTITVAIGSEVPPAGRLPHMVVIEPGEKVVLRGSAIPAINASAVRNAFGGFPRYVRIKVAILRDLKPFAALIRDQKSTPQTLPDALFDQWFESNDTIFLNSLPVAWIPRQQNDVESRSAAVGGGV